MAMQWIAPEALKKSPADINSRAADMWSYAVMLWEMSMREIPFGDLAPMEAGMRIATEGLRLDISPGVSPHMAKLIKICMNEDPGKRPTFDMIIPPALDEVVAFKVAKAVKDAALSEPI